MTPSNIVLALALTATALITGLYYGYSCSVNPGLGKLSDAEYLASMQSINKAILNPVFFASFAGTLVLLPLSAYLNYNPMQPLRFYWLVAASAMYIIGSFGVTMFGNVPLNEALAAFEIKSATALELHSARSAFEPKWNMLHQIRTIASVICFVLAAFACLEKTTQQL